MSPDESSLAKVLVSHTALLTRIDQTQRHMTDRLERIDVAVGNLSDIVTGNGGREGMNTRLRLLEDHAEKSEKELADACEKIDNLERLAISWKNRGIGIMSVLAFLNVLLGIWIALAK